MNLNKTGRAFKPRSGPVYSRRGFLATTLLSLCGGNRAAFASRDEEVCLSLSAVSRKAAVAIKAGRALPWEVECLGGIGWLTGYVLDPVAHDVILVGRQSSSRPSLHFEDLVVNLRNTWGQHAHPYCSLDPRRQDVQAVNALFQSVPVISSLEQMQGLYAHLKSLWGPQQVVVGGVPDSSRHARVMIAADYHMKQFSQGHVTVPEVTSYFDLGLQDMKRALRSGNTVAAQRTSMARFWFHLGAGEPAYYTSNGLVWLERCSVVLLTENQRAATDGTLHDSGEEDPIALTFAGQVTREYARLGRRATIYEDMENLYRLSAVLRAAHFRSATDEAGFSPHFLLHQVGFRSPKPLPPTLPGLVNGRQETVPVSGGAYLLHPMVCGGVGMEMRLTRACFKTAPVGWAERIRLAALRNRPDAEALCWPLRRTA